MVHEAVKEAMEKMTEQVQQGRSQERVMEVAYVNQGAGLGEEFELVQDKPPEQQRSALVPTGECQCLSTSKNHQSQIRGS